MVLNHIYEHVVDADKVLSEIRRVLRDDGVAYFGFGNKYGVMEPHYKAAVPVLVAQACGGSPCLGVRASGRLLRAVP